MSTRASNTPDRASASIPGAISPEHPGTTEQRIPKENVEPAYAHAGSKAAATGIRRLDEVIGPIVLGKMTARFSIPDPARPHLLKFGDTLVTLENAIPGEVSCLLYVVISNFEDGDETSLYECVQHLLSLGADVNLTKGKFGNWLAPLRLAVMRNSVPLVSLLLSQGARPDECYEFVDHDGKMKTDVAREMLKAGADPWRSLGDPEQVPGNSLVKVAEFYKQTGLNINAESRRTRAYRDAACEQTVCVTALEQALVTLSGITEPSSFLKDLLDAGAHVGDPIRVGSNETGELHLTNLFGPAIADAIASYRAQRAFLPCGFSPYTLLHGTLQPGSPNATDPGAASLARSTAVPVTTSGSALAQAGPEASLQWPDRRTLFLRGCRQADRKRQEHAARLCAIHRASVVAGARAGTLWRRQGCQSRAAGPGDTGRA
jgi:hypothetical protein